MKQLIDIALELLNLGHKPPVARFDGFAQGPFCFPRRLSLGILLTGDAQLLFCLLTAISDRLVMRRLPRQSEASSTRASTALGNTARKLFVALQIGFARRSAR